MIISRTPLRVSFCGGGTDLPAYYEGHQKGGLVTSMALQRYIYVTINKRFDDSIRVSYSQTEEVDNFEEIQHELVKEAMRKTGVTRGVEVTTIAEIPSRGTGLGSSSSLTVGLLNAFYAYTGRYASPDRLAREACEIEMDLLGAPIGKQDQYAAAFGGINHIRFKPDSEVIVDPVRLSSEERNRVKEEFFLLYTGLTRKASSILAEQSVNTQKKMNELNEMREQAKIARIAFEEGDFEGVGELLAQAWNLKKQLAGGISNPQINDLHDGVMRLGASGGKLLGAGGGGFLIFHADADVRRKVIEEYPNYRILPLEIEPYGSRIIYHDGNEENEEQ